MTGLLFTSHSGAVSGAERVLLDIVSAHPGASAFVFEEGDLPARLREAALSVHVSEHGQRLSGARRDTGLLALLPMLSTLVRLTAEMVRHVGMADIVYANSQKAFTLAAIACGVRRRPLVWHLHDILSPAHFGTAQRLIQTRLANWVARRVIVPSNAAAHAFIEAGGREDLVVVVPNGIQRDVDRRSKDELRSALGLPKDRILAGVFSRLSPWKGQHVVLEALEKAHDVTAVFAGAALFGETDYADSLHRKAQEAGLADRALFLGQRSDVPLLMQAMDLVIHPSIDPEPFGLTLVEAMLAGVPLLASDAGASTEILQGGQFGRLFAPDNPAALAAALNDQLRFQREDSAGAADKVRFAREHALKTYSVVQMNAAILHCLDAIREGR